MNTEQLIFMMESIAGLARSEGQYCKFDPVLPSIDINGVYYFQEWQAEELLETVPEGISVEDYLLYVSQSWGE